MAACPPTTAGGPSGGTPLVDSVRGVAAWAAAVAARPRAPDSRADESRQRTVRRSMATLQVLAPGPRAPPVQAALHQMDTRQDSTSGTPLTARRRHRA